MVLKRRARPTMAFYNKKLLRCGDEGLYTTSELIKSRAQMYRLLYCRRRKRS